jgi:3-methyladenine DNA glycosylase AlkD
MDLKETLNRLEALGRRKNIEGMKRFNIAATKTFGVTAPKIRMLAGQIGKDHSLALALWDSGYHEARILAALIAEPEKAKLKQLDRWVRDIENWAQCDACCLEYFQKTQYAPRLPERWTKNRGEFVRRAGIVMIAAMAVHHKKSSDEEMMAYFPLLKEYAVDERNFVKKAVNWSLRQIGKRNGALRKKAIALTEEIQNISSVSARWIASDALREFNDPRIIERTNRKKEFAE